ncbi:hypothetical protein [Streptomyces sp. NPDC048256]|uniref:hypothetical protein n=1 Tax=unclassified Streptomyces TaxID=2593676 RepID=UPI003410C5A4
MTATSVEQVNGTAVTRPERGFDAVALAEADAIRARTAAETEAALMKAQAEADAIRAKAEADAEKQRLANRRQAITLEEKEADHAEKMAESDRRRKESERLARQAEEQAAAEQEAAGQQAAEMADADEKWRKYAIRFAIVCGIVSLPVQMSFFWNREAPWMAAAPIMLEGAAWVVHRGARAAAVGNRPVWHYRTIVWLLAFIAAAVNLYHGLHSFDPGTALSTAFASIAGPGVWDLHEHGRLRRRGDTPTRRERKAAAKEAKRIAAEQAERELRESERQAYREKAAREATAQLAADREAKFPKVWEHALKLAADLGETTVTQAIWKQAKLDVEGALPGESADVIRMRNAAEARVEAAREKRSVNGSTAQVASQVLGPKKPRVYNPPARRGKRTKGDVQYSAGARRQASLAARNATAKKDPS